MVYMLERAPSRYAFYIDTGDLPPDQAAALVNKVRRRYKKKKLIDPSTGKLDLRINPLNSSEDFWVPTRGGKESTRIDTITGPSYDNIENVEYFQNKLMDAIGIPRSYWGSDDVQKGALAQEDVIFARTEMRIQREFRNGIKKIVRLHLAALNIDPDSVEWEVEMSPPSAIFELQQIEVMNAQAALAETLEAYYPKWWLLERVFHHTSEEAAFISAEAFAEKDAEMKKQAETQADIIQRFPEVAGEMAPPEEEQVEDKRVDMDKKLVKLTTLLERNRENGEDIKRHLKKIGPDMLRKMRRSA
jgi:hypothetical protein